MKFPRDMDGPELVKALERIGYQVVRQSGSHIRLHTDDPKRHSITVPNHRPLKLGTFSAIFNDVAKHREMSREALANLLFG